MWIKLNSDGLKVELKIEKYIPNQTIDGEWTSVSFNFEFQDIIKYTKNDSELILCSEVDDLISYMENLLENKLTQKEEYGCIEPDFLFVFNPKKLNPPIDASMELKINLWHGGLTCNYFSTTFGIEEIEQLYLYFLLISNKISKNDERILTLIKSGVIYEN